MTDSDASQTASSSPTSPPSHAGLRSAGIGFGAGLLNGLLGIGGGILLVPGMIFLRGATPRQAVSTSLGTVLCLSSMALVVHLAISGLYFSLLGSGLLLAAGIVGSQVGGYLLNRVPQRWILYLFAAFTFVASTNLILQGLGFYGHMHAAAEAPSLWSYPTVGVVSGLFSGILGIGGGGMVVLIFSAFFHTPILGGVPLALAVNVVNASSGVIAQRGKGHTLWREVVRLVPSAVVGIGVGVGLAVVMPANLLRLLFAIFFLYMGSRLFLRGIKS
ncbi:MAG TPA: sulfite exporter TauE/SafE family protein [bacterium]|nr:sulfite exporter TauE/SafE family protein [bacterium]